MATPVDCVCMFNGGIPIGSGFCGVHDVAAGVVDASVTGVEGVVNLATRVVGKGVDVVAAASLIMGTSRLVAYG